MAFGSFFKTPRHKSFNYKPVYYDPEMEDLRERVERTEREIKGQSDETYVPHIKGQMKNYRIEQKFSSNTRHQLVRLIIISVTVVLLIMIFYLIIEITGFLY